MKGRERRMWSVRGQDLVEYALILPVLLMLILGTADFAIIVFSYDTIANAAREGARYGVVHPTDLAGIETMARRLTEGLDPASLSIAVDYPGGNTIRVEVAYDLPLLTGFLIRTAGGSSTLRLRAVTTMQIE